MRANAVARALPLHKVVFVTTDDSVIPEIEQNIAPNFETFMLRTGDEAILSLEELSPAAILLDLDTVGIGDEDGLQLLRKLRLLNEDLVLIALTRLTTRSVRLRAGQYGADEFFIAPLDFDELRIVLGRAIEKRSAEAENRRIRDEIANKYTFCDLIGGSEAMHAVYDAIRRVAPSNTTILIRGESGTGKELVARALVSLSPRAAKPFISVNCAALPENLIEAELFGHERGAFTGAHQSRAGHIEMADGGTLFLDEIATLGLNLQTKLLRVLEDRAVQRIGGKTVKKIDFRLLCATNEDLEQMVKTGKFREDLYYRIHVIPIALPPLRERPGDVALLIDHFLRIYCSTNDIPMKRLTPDALEILENSPWPGNVRELENVIQRLVLMVEAPIVTTRDLPEKLLYTSAASHEALLIPEEGIEFDEELQRIEIAYIQAAIRRAGTKAGAATLLHIPNQKMKYLCRKYKI